MKAKLSAGSEIDFVTKDELEDLFKQYLSGFLRGPQTIRVRDGVLLNSSGESIQAGTQTGFVDLFEVAPGLEFRLHRLGIFPDTYTFGAPFTSGTGYAEIGVNGIAEDGIPFTAPGLPRVWTGGDADGIVYTNGQRVQVNIVDGPVSVACRVSIQGTLDTTSPDLTIT